jgi:hypothetical protein
VLDNRRREAVLGNRRADPCTGREAAFMVAGGGLGTHRDSLLMGR